MFCSLKVEDSSEIITKCVPDEVEAIQVYNSYWVIHACSLKAVSLTNTVRSMHCNIAQMVLILVTE